MENEVELKVIESGVTKTGEAFEKLIAQLEKTNNALAKMEKTGTKFGKSIANGMKEATNAVDDAGKKTDSFLKKLEGFNTISDTFKNTVSVVKDFGSKFYSFVGSAIDYSEELNLFNVVFKNNMTEIGTQFSKAGLEAEKFQQTLHEAFGTNLQETRRFQSLYQSMGENMGIVTDKAEVMSSNLEKLTYDIASLYNASEEDVGQAIRAGVYAGQTKPLRRFGIDVTQVSMQPILDELGIEKSISELSQAEKQLIRYMSVMKQSSVAHGDFANTIEAPANQIKIFKQQCVEARIALGNLFVGAFARILPYANAILMVIKEVSKAIANFFGIKVSDYNTGISTSVNDFNDLGDSVGGVGDSADKASKAVKELKRQTLGFDQINNITTPTPTSGSSGGGGGASGGGAIGGIDQRLLDALKGYENGMEKIRMKANEIRDKIMDWLGFTKVIDPLTGEVSWKFEGIGKMLKNMWENFKGLSATGKVLMGLGIIGGATTLLAIGGKLISVFGKTGLGKAVIALVGPTTSLLSTIASSKGTISASVTEWQKHRGILDENGEAVGSFAGKLATLKTALTGALVSIGGMAVYYDSFKNLREEGASLVNVLGMVGGGIATIGGAMTVGASVGGVYGMAIGGVVGALVLLVETMSLASDYYPQYTKQHEELKKEIDEVTDSYHREINAIREGVKESATQIESDEKLARELMTIVDANGRVKAGYEDRANFIIGRLNDAYGTEISMTNGVIDNYDSIKGKIFDVIEAKKAQIYFNAYEKEYEQSVLAEKEAQEKVEKAVKTRNGAMSELADLQDRANYLTEYNTAIAKQLEEEGLDPLSKRYRDLTEQLQANYNELETNSIKQNELNGKIKDFDSDVKKATETYVEATNTQNRYSDIWKAQQEGNWAEVERLYKEGTDKTTKTFRESLVKQAQAVGEGEELPQQVIEGFRVLALNSEKEYNKALSELPKDTSKQIDDSLKETTKKKKSAYGTYFNYGEEAKKGVNNATKGLGDDTVKQFTGEFNSKSSKNKFNNAGKTAGKETMSGFKSETNKGVDVKVKPNTSGVTNNVGNAVNNWGNGYRVDLYPKIKGNAQITVVQRALGGIFSNGVWKNIKQYASGGIPTHGTLFNAGERGPEIVGHIGNRTEVLNQSQLASVMYEAVSRALTNSDFGGVEVYAHTDEGVIIDRINRRTRQTGQCPIEI